MNKPENPEGLLKRARNVGERAFTNARDAGQRAWDKFTEGEDEQAKRRKVIFLLVGGIVAIIILLSVLSRIGGESAIERADTPTAMAVSAVTVQVHPLHATISLTGEARPIRDIQVAAPATGVRILQLLVDEGDYVREGQPMARLDTALANAQTRAAQASVAEAESAAIRARGEYERAESIRDSGALSTEAIEQRRAAATAADARLAAARAQLAEVNARLGGGYVRAPAAGLVIDRMAEIGRSVDGQILFRIAAGNRLEVAAQVAEADALALREGQIATFNLVDGSTVEAQLRRLPASIDSRTRTGEALFSLPRETRVRAGMYLRGQALIAPRDAIAVPQSSILYDNGQAYVLVIDDTNHVRRTDVTLGLRSGDLVEIVTGLDLNQRIVGSGAAFLQDGDEVRLLEAQPAEATLPSGGENLRGRN